MTNKFFFNKWAMKTGMENEIEKTKTLLEKWNNVTLKTKKDGKPFAAISKGITGADIVTIKNEKAIQVRGFYNFDLGNGKEKARVMAEDIITMPALSAEAIEQTKADRVEQLERRLQELDAMLNNLDKAYNQYEQEYNNAISNLKENCNSEELQEMIYKTLTR